MSAAIGSLQFTDPRHICVATDLLSKMLSESESLGCVPDSREGVGLIGKRQRDHQLG
jgi:hypothetical protein